MENSKAFVEAKHSIADLYLSYGEPARDNGRDTTTETQGYALAVADSEDIEEVVNNYNIELETLARMIDKRHVGSNIWYTSYYQTEAFSKFAEEASVFIQDFIETYEW